MGARVTSLSFGDLRIEGCSRAGDETWFRVHPPGIGFDAGRGALGLVGVPHLFLSHGHLDHALGVPFILSQRTVHELESTRLYCPRQVAEPLVGLAEAAARLEGVTYRYRVQALAPGDRVELGKGLAVAAFALDHVVPALGYHLIRRRRRLAAPYRGQPGAELARRRAAGEQIEEEIEDLRLSYCGDTGPGVFDSEPRLYAAEVLVLECTFLDPAHRERARRYGHTHLDDVVERADRFRNRALVLHHLSRRHRLEELRAALAARAPGLVDRVHLIGGER